MDYFIISKVEYLNNKVTYTQVGYTLNPNDCQIINDMYDSTLGAWVEENKAELEAGTKQISEYFISNPCIHDARHSTTSIEGMGLSEITNINELCQ